ncbi:glycosyltransferase family 1 protein [Heliorestis acidaminivorans]|uniref:Glycosyltransferase family 1 protein n=1 Tax=Heliorestis acidaminivorans TaxID=553427 RepID=A0A6I0EVN4_9FIRM|nr:glycosyltransferase [Heliorestis acidaminivorans]KAB2953649.1 glycosyltransferase family 1 protein [Heliorestis acidaminivorans]
MNIVCIAAAEWQGMWARAQQLMVRLAAQGHKILYVDPPITYIAPLKNPALWKSRWQEKKGLQIIEKDQIYLLKPPLFLPFHGMNRSVNRINQQILAQSLSQAFQELNWSEAVLWTYLPGSCDLTEAKNLSWSKVIYDCVDDHGAFTGLIDQKVMQAMENDLAKQSHAVFASAKALAEKMKKVRPDVKIVPNGADVEHFRRPLGLEKKDIEKRKDLPRNYDRIIGFVGGLGDWIDIELMAKVAQHRQDCALVVIGPAETDLSPLEGMENVFLLGRKPYQELPSHVQHFDVALSPFKLNELTMSVNPVKIYEYLAAGCPVVSTALPEVIPFEPVIAVGYNEAEFLQHIDKALAENSPEKARERVQMAEAHSWESRLSDMVTTLA